MSDLSESLRNIQEEARQENLLKIKLEEQQAALAEEAELMRLRTCAEKQFDGYVDKLKETARKSPDSKKLKMDIGGGGDDSGRIIGQRLVELFAEQGMKATRHSSSTDNYYGCHHTFHWLEFELDG